MKSDSSFQLDEEGVALTTHIIQRHGNAARAEKDLDRMLSDKGREQAQLMQEKLIGRGLAPAHLTLSSPAPRAIDTVGQDCIKLDVLYPVGLPNLDALFSKLGYAPLRTYLEQDTTGEIMDWAERALKAMNEETEKHADGVVRVGCHAVVSNALALVIIGDRNPAAREQILDLNLGEACCIVIRSDRTVEILEPY